jgi:site-specific recombinase XerD
MTNQPTVHQPVQFTIVRQQGQISACTTSSALVNHFLDVVKATRAYNTWVSYTYDLKTFFALIRKPPEAIDRRDCLAFMKQQQQDGRSDATINRRLAAVSSLFDELQLLETGWDAANPIHPRTQRQSAPQRNPSLYRRQPKRLPDTLPDSDLRQFFSALPTWRDRSLMLLMWISCLRISEAVAIQFEDIECSRRSIRISQAKGNHPRLVFMDPSTFAALNRYLDEERGNLFPEINAVFVALKGKARGQPLTVNAVQKLFAYYADECGLRHIHAHLFRHTGITQLVQQKMSEPAIRKLVGHRRPESLLPYLHLGDDFVESEFERAQAALDSAHQLTQQLTGGVS